MSSTSVTASPKAPTPAACEPTTPRSLQESFYRGHLEDVARLYDCRQELLCDWTSTLDDVAELEARMEAHLDELVLGGEAALAVALMTASPDAPWSFYALVALVCRLGCFPMVCITLLEMNVFCNDEDTDDEAAAALRRAVADAVVHHLADERAELMGTALRGASQHVLPVLATCVGARGWVQAADELRRAAVEPCADPAAVLRALGQLPGLAPGMLRASLGHPDPVVAQTAAVGALRRGEAGVLEWLARRPHAPWAALPIAMGGGPEVGPWLVEAARGEEPTQALVALGIFGDPRGVDVLLEQLHVGAYADAAAIGLFLLTGALREACAGDIGEIDDREELAPRSPRVSVRGAGISTDPAAWTQWVEANRDRLRPGQRYRLGTSAGPRADLAALSSSLPLWLRRCLADEFVIRYGVQWTYEPDLPVARQREIVRRVRARLDDPRLRFADGFWYFQGRLAVVGEWPPQC